MRCGGNGSSQSLWAGSLLQAAVTQSNTRKERRKFNNGSVTTRGGECNHGLVCWKGTGTVTVSIPPLSFGVHVGVVLRWSNLNGASSHRRVFRHQLDGVVEIPGLNNPESRQLLLGFRVWTIGDCDFSVSVVQSGRGLGALQCFSTDDVPIFPHLG